MTQTNDPPLISSIDLIPDAAEKADLDAPNTSGGKLIIGQAPNITITETTVVADADERLALDVQEGDIAIQTNVSTSFIFTGGDNVANNWETLDFDAVGAIDGEDITPRDITPRDITASGDITATGNISLQNLTVAGAINGADTSAAAAGEALTADGTGGFDFASAGGDLIGLVSATPESVGGFFNSAGAMAVILASQTAMQSVAASQTAMQEVAASETVMQEVAASQTAMQEVINSTTAIQEVVNSTTADQEFYLSDLFAETLDAFSGIDTGVTGGVDDIAVSQTAMQEVVNSSTAMERLAASQTAMQEVAASQTAMEEVAPSPTAMFEIGKSATAQAEITSSNTAFNALDANTVSGSKTSTFDLTEIADLSVTNVNVWVKSIFAPQGTGTNCFNELEINPDGPNFDQSSDISVTIEDFVTSVRHGQCVNGNTSFEGGTTTYEFIPVE